MEKPSNLLIITVLLLSAKLLEAKENALIGSIIGPTTVIVGNVAQYEYDAGIAVYYPTWNCGSLGYIEAESRSGNIYYVTIRWTTPGTAVLKFFEDGGQVQLASKSVTLNALSVPVTTYGQVKNCGNTIVTRNASPPANSTYDWWWQTSPTGTLTTLGSAASITITVQTTLYLRARTKVSPYSWSTATAGTTFQIQTPPTNPVGSTNANVISNTATPVTLSVSPVAGVDGYGWFTESGTQIAGQTLTSYTPLLNQTTTFYVASFIGNCYSPNRTPVTGNIYPEPIITSTNYGRIVMSQPVTLSVNNFPYSTYQWLDGVGNPIAGANGVNYVAGASGNYKVKVSNNGSTFFTSPSFTVGVGLQGQNLNYVTTNDILVASVAEASIDALPVTKTTKVTQYFDGLGRPVQTVGTQSSPLKRDIIQPVVYDAYGRESKKYLPYSSENNGWFKAMPISNQLQFYSAANDIIANDSVPFGKLIYEASPLSRIEKEYGAGAAWSTQDKPVRYIYLTNQFGSTGIQEKIIAWTINAAGLPIRRPVITNFVENGGYYSTGQLTVKVTKDEQDNEVREYTSKSGQIILKKVQAVPGAVPAIYQDWAYTYYVYDDFGNLRYVFQPELSKKIHAQGDAYVVTSTDLDAFTFQYKYDSHKRMTEKRVPGGGWVYMVYDSRDRVVLTQDGNQRGINPTSSITRYWTFTKYDQLNRPILTGIKDTTTTALTQAEMQLKVDQFYQKSWTRLYETFVGSGAGNVHGYTNKSYPVCTSAATVNPEKFLTVSYYDNYNFRGDWLGDYSFKNDTLSATVEGVTYQHPATGSENTRVLGLATGSKVKVLDGGVTGWYTWLKSATYYDEKNRTIQVITDNYKGGQDRISNLYDFSGKVLQSKTSHLESDVTWRNLTNVRQIGNKLTKISGSNTAWDADAISAQVLAAGQNGYVEWIVGETSANKMIGLASSDPNASYTGINYAFYMNINVLKIYENGTIKATLSGTLVAQDQLRIERTGTTVKYYKNNVLVYTSTVASSTALFVDCSMYTVTTTPAVLTGVRASFGSKMTIIRRRMEYDHAGRLEKTYHQLGTSPEILLTHNEYNELGQLVDKKLHTVSNVPRQSVDYRYNIRGWLTSINDAALSAGDANDLFGIELAYNEDAGTGNSAAYNGNISAVKWSRNLGLGTITQNGYNYSYDPMNRILSASFKEKTSSWATPTNQAFTDGSYSYDLNGNIQGLIRYDQSGTTAIMDNLVYNYGTAGTYSNKLLKVTDTGSRFKGFVDGTNSGDDYTYDANGNMLTDQNKGIVSNITYNFLNLPETVVKGGSGGNWIQYIYDATGKKLSQVTFFSLRPKQTDYVGEFQYEDDVLQFIQHDEGRIVLDSTRLVYTNTCESTTGFVASAASLTTFTGNGSEKYVVVTATSATARAGVSTIGGTFNVTGGQTYKLRIKGYRDKGTAAASSAVYTNVKAGGTDLNWPGATIILSGSTSVTDSWSEQTVTVPVGATTLTIGVQWNTAPAIGEKIYINEVQLTLEARQQPEYQYHLKDHLGNVRLTFTTRDEVEEQVATLETANQSAERNQFLYYDEAVKVNHDLYDHTYNGSTGATYYATRLTGGSTNAIFGLAKSISVMPGDTINTEVYAKYLDPNSANWTTALNTFITSIANGTAPAGTLVDGGSAGSLGGASYPFTTISHSSETGSAPKAYLNYLVFNKDMTTVLAHGFQRITTASREYGQNATHDRLASQIPITEPGYVYIYLSNENPTAVEVYFDDFSVEHIKSPVVQTDDYYPFGLTFNSYQRENSVANLHQYNGKEKQDELGLDWLDYGARMYMPELGRWMAVDPLAGKYFSLSPYNYAANIPTVLIDPDGRKIEWGDNVTREDKRMIKKALREHNSSSTYKNLYKELKKSDNRYVVKTERDEGSTGAYFDSNYTQKSSYTSEAGTESTMEMQNPVTQGDFKPGEKGGVIVINTYWADMKDPNDIASYLVEEVVHAAQYESFVGKDKNAGTDVMPPGKGTADGEFEAKAIVGQIKTESKRQLITSQADRPAEAFGANAFRTGNLNGYQNALNTWYSGATSYHDKRVTGSDPALLKKLIK